MSESAASTHSPIVPVPPDDPGRTLTVVRDRGNDLPHIGLVGDTYTVLVSGQNTAGRFCIIAMHIPPGGGPPPHRHDFEETFILQEGEMEATFRGQKLRVAAGDTLHIPANAPHQFRNGSGAPVQLLCICSPAGAEEFFASIGVLVETAVTPPPPLDAATQAAFREKAEALAPLYHTELLPPA